MKQLTPPGPGVRIRRHDAARRARVLTTGLSGTAAAGLMAAVGLAAPALPTPAPSTSAPTQTTRPPVPTTLLLSTVLPTTPAHVS